MRGSKQVHGSRAKRRGYRSQRNGTPSCWANFLRCLACMAISYRTLIWLRWLWNTGLPFAPRTVILRGFGKAFVQDKIEQADQRKPAKARSRSGKPERVVIVGGGAAGFAAAEMLR